MDKKQTGAWLIHHTNKLNNIATNNLFGYEEIQEAGKAGLLLSSLSASEEQTLSLERVSTLARIANIGKTEQSHFIEMLKKQQLIDTSEKEIVILGLTNHSILQHTAEIFENVLESTSLQKATLQLAEEVSVSPEMDSDVSKKISDKYKLSKNEISNLLTDSQNFGFVDYETIENGKLLFNGNLFRRENIEKLNKILSALKQDEINKLNELNSKLDNYGCMLYDDAQKILGGLLCSKIIPIGLFDITFLSNENGSIGFITKPSAFQKFGSNSILDDTFDLAKALITSITYGMQRSDYKRGKIVKVDALLKKLIDGGSVGPVKAIGKDYQLLEHKGVVKVTPDTYYRDRFNMKLLKKEVGELALTVLKTGSANEYSLNLPSISGTIKKFSSPEENRVISRKKQIEMNPKITQDILLSLRTGKL